MPWYSKSKLDALRLFGHRWLASCYQSCQEDECAGIDDYPEYEKCLRACQKECMSNE